VTIRKSQKSELLVASILHREDVAKVIGLLCDKLVQCASRHDEDKITEIDEFYKDFSSGFERQEWWRSHRVCSRHHLETEDGVPDDVNLIDVLEHIVDGVTAGLARAGRVRDFDLSNDLLQTAVKNTVLLLKKNIEIVGE